MQVSTTTTVYIEGSGTQCTLSLIICITLIGPITLVMFIGLKHSPITSHSSVRHQVSMSTIYIDNWSAQHITHSPLSPHASVRHQVSMSTIYIDNWSAQYTINRNVVMNTAHTQYGWLFFQ